MNKKDRLVELSKMYTLLDMYVDFYNFNLSTECVKHEINFKQAENLSILCNLVTSCIDGIKESSPSDFLYKQKQYTNDAINSYKIYKEKLDNCSESYLNKRAVDGFCKHVYYYLKDSSGKIIYLRIRPTDFMEIPFAMSIYIMYLRGLLLKKDVENHQWVDFLCKNKIDSKILKRIIRTVRQAERLYNEIEEKIDNRCIKSLLNK